MLVPFFWRGFYDPFSPPKFFFHLRGISVGALSESKILKISGHARKPLKLGTLYRKAGYYGMIDGGTCIIGNLLPYTRRRRSCAYIGGGGFGDQ